MQRKITKPYAEEFLKQANKTIKTAELLYGNFFKIWCCCGLRFNEDALEIEYDILPHETAGEKLLLKTEQVLSFVESALSGEPGLFPDAKQEVKGSDALKQFLAEMKSGDLKKVFGRDFDSVVCVVDQKHKHKEIKILKELGFSQLTEFEYKYDLK